MEQREMGVVLRWTAAIGFVPAVALAAVVCWAGHGKYNQRPTHCSYDTVAGYLRNRRVSDAYIHHTADGAWIGMAWEGH